MSKAILNKRSRHLAPTFPVGFSQRWTLKGFIRQVHEKESPRSQILTHLADNVEDTEMHLGLSADDEYGQMRIFTTNGQWEGCNGKGAKKNPKNNFLRVFFFAPFP